MHVYHTLLHGKPYGYHSYGYDYCNSWICAITNMVDTSHLKLLHAQTNA